MSREINNTKKFLLKKLGFESSQEQDLVTSVTCDPCRSRHTQRDSFSKKAGTGSWWMVVLFDIESLTEGDRLVCIIRDISYLLCNQEAGSYTQGVMFVTVVGYVQIGENWMSSVSDILSEISVLQKELFTSRVWFLFWKMFCVCTHRYQQIYIL